MKPRPIIFWGATGQAKVLRELVHHLGFELVALFDNDTSISSPFAEVPLFSGRTAFLKWRERRSGELHGLVAIGGNRGCDRLMLQDWLASTGVVFQAVVHPRAFVAQDAIIGAGSQILANATVAVGTSLGRACIINHNASVDHECHLEDGVHVAPGATLCGCVTVGECSLVGAGAVVLPRLRIGANAVVGAGAVVTRDVPDKAVVAGNPARTQRAEG